jgi:hypothetical protein
MIEYGIHDPDVIGAFGHLHPTATAEQVLQMNRDRCAQAKLRHLRSAMRVTVASVTSSSI